MIELQQSSSFAKWFASLADAHMKASIQARLFRLQHGAAGDAKSLGKGLFELRLHLAGGIRIYYMQRGKTLIVLLGGGDKSTQERDIKKARIIATEWE